MNSPITAVNATIYRLAANPEIAPLVVEVAGALPDCVPLLPLPLPDTAGVPVKKVAPLGIGDGNAEAEAPIPTSPPCPCPEFP